MGFDQEAPSLPEFESKTLNLLDMAHLNCCCPTTETNAYPPQPLQPDAHGMFVFYGPRMSYALKGRQTCVAGITNSTIGLLVLVLWAMRGPEADGTLTLGFTV